MISSVASLETS